MNFRLEMDIILITWYDKISITILFDEHKRLASYRIAPFNLKDDEVQGPVGPSCETGLSQSNGYHDGERSGPLDIVWKYKIAWVSICKIIVYV